MRSHRGVPVHPWTPLVATPLFDQTNGTVDVTGDRAEDGRFDEQDYQARMARASATMGAVSVGM